MIKNLFIDSKEIDLDEIDYIIINHSEIDHSGAFTRVDERDTRYANLLYK